MSASTAIRFSATLQRPAEPEAAAWTFLRVPAAASAKLPTRSLVTMEGTLAGQPFQATLQPDGEGSHWLKVEQALRASEERFRSEIEWAASDLQRLKTLLEGG